MKHLEDHLRDFAWWCAARAARYADRVKVSTWELLSVPRKDGTKMARFTVCIGTRGWAFRAADAADGAKNSRYGSIVDGTWDEMPRAASDKIGLAACRKEEIEQLDYLLGLLHELKTELEEDSGQGQTADVETSADHDADAAGRRNEVGCIGGDAGEGTAPTGGGYAGGENGADPAVPAEHG